MPTHQWLPEFSDEARDKLKKLSSTDRKAIFTTIAALLASSNPLAIPGMKKLVGSDGQWRMRQGDYRIIISLETQEIVKDKYVYKGTIYIDDIEHRKDVYKKGGN
ncbi:MAG: type II toxin-antitoxin system RelE/ParE family toxin [Anaerolineae bacterium]|nr:type II toxin-antitoxin system RelE/ParE family toxin [Anaerolineae bacterium]